MEVCDRCNSCEDGKEDCREYVLKYQKAKEKVIKLNNKLKTD